MMWRIGIGSKGKIIILVATVLLIASGIPSALAKSGPRVTGGGWFYEGTSKNNFAIRIGDTGQGALVEFHDRDKGYSFHGFGVTNFYVAPDNTAHVFGYGWLNGPDVYLFHVIAEDNGEPGDGNDVFSLWIYRNQIFDYSTGTLGGGNIQVEP